MARPRKGTTQSWGRRGSGCPRGEEYEGSLVRLPSPENNRICGWVEGWPGGSTASHGRREQAVSPALVWAAGAGRSEIEEARRPLDGHPIVSAVC